MDTNTCTALPYNPLSTELMFGEIIILGQKSQLRIYTQITLGYDMPADYHAGDAVSVLKAGIGELAACVPWLAGTIVIGVFSTPPVSQNSTGSGSRHGSSVRSNSAPG